MIAVNLIESLLRVSYLICSNYKALAQLELDGQEGTEKYNTLLKGIKVLEGIENELYSVHYSGCRMGAIENKSLAKEALKRLNKQFLTDDYKKINRPELIVFNQFKTPDLSLLRVVNRVMNFDVNLTLEKKVNGSTEKNLHDPEILTSVAALLATRVDVVKSIDDIESILNIEIRDKSNDEETRKSLIEAKYDYYSMFEHNFNMPGYEEFKKQISIAMRESLIDFLKDKVSKINMKMSLIPENKRKILLTTIYVRARLLNLDEEDKEILKKQIQSLIDQQRIQDSYGTKLFMKLIDQSYYDKECENTLGL